MNSAGNALPLIRGLVSGQVFPEHAVNTSLYARLRHPWLRTVLERPVRLPSCSVAVVGCALALVAAPAIAETVRFTGEARVQGGDRLFCTEHHEQQGSCEGPNWIPETNRVTYRNPEGDVIAEKTVDYSEAAERPGFVLDDQRFEQRMEVRNRGDRKAIVDWVTGDGQRTRLEASIPSNGVIDAGFEVMVRNHWDTLIENGDDVEIQFFAPTRGTFYRFEAQPAEHDAIDAEHVFRITATGWVSTWFVDDIYLGYSSERRLTDFYGLTNIPKTPDEYYTAHIHYQYDAPAVCG